MTLTKKDTAELLRKLERIETCIRILKRTLFNAEMRTIEQLDEIIRPTYGAKVPDIKSPQDKEIEAGCRAIDAGRRRKKQAELAKARQDALKKQADVLNISRPPISKYLTKV